MNYFDIDQKINDSLKILLQDGPSYIRVFVSILRDIFKEDTVEYVLALIDEMLSGKWCNTCALRLDFAMLLG